MGERRLHCGLAGKFPFLTGPTITQQEPNTLSATVDCDGPVMVSFFGLPDIPHLRSPHLGRCHSYLWAEI